MSLSHYIIRYTLKHLFKGRKKRYAELLSEDPSNFRRIMRVITYSKGNPRIMEQTLENYLLEHRDYIQMLAGYEAVEGHIGTREPACSKEHTLKHAKETLMKMGGIIEWASEFDGLITQTEGMIKEMEHQCCGRNGLNQALCASYDGYGDEVPDVNIDHHALACMKLNEFVDSLNAMMLEGISRLEKDATE